MLVSVGCLPYFCCVVPTGCSNVMPIRTEYYSLHTHLMNEAGTLTVTTRLPHICNTITCGDQVVPFTVESHIINAITLRKANDLAPTGYLHIPALPSPLAVARYRPSGRKVAL